MPCYKCSNGKYKYGLKGNCQFDTLKACEAAERAIHARENNKNNMEEQMAGKKKPHDRERREEPYHSKKPKK